MAKHKVKQGECISSIAEQYGLFPNALWNQPENSQLKRRRKNPNVLFPSDELFIPERQEKSEKGSTEQLHRFRKRGVPAKLRVRIQRNNKTIADAEYTLEIESNIYEGWTDPDGWIEESIHPGARKGKLILRAGHRQFNLQLGYLDPIDELSGVQARLKNLGFDPGPIDGKMGPRTQAALREFQESHELKQSGRENEETMKLLQELHGA